MSFIERFKARQVIAPDIEIEIGEMKFIVSRFAQMEIEAGKDEGRKKLRNEGLDPESVSTENLLSAIGWGVAEYVKRHVKNWIHTPKNGEPPLPFNKATLDKLFEEMDISERVQLGFGYLIAVNTPATEEQKKTKGSSLALES